MVYRDESGSIVKGSPIFGCRNAGSDVNASFDGNNKAQKTSN
jgi:hypothetical protein